MFFLFFHVSNALKLQISSYYLLPLFCYEIVKIGLSKILNRTVSILVKLILHANASHDAELPVSELHAQPIVPHKVWVGSVGP
jgi:hypothetical protein